MFGGSKHDQQVSHDVCIVFVCMCEYVYSNAGDMRAATALNNAG